MVEKLFSRNLWLRWFHIWVRFKVRSISRNIWSTGLQVGGPVHQTYGHLSLNTCSGSRYGAIKVLSSMT